MSSGTFIAGSACAAQDQTTYIFELAITSLSGVLAVQCDIEGMEGLGYATHHYGSITLIDRSPSSFDVLNATEMQSTVEAVLLAVQAEAGLRGMTGILGQPLIAAQQGGSVDLVRIANGVSNALAASATAGYLGLVSTTSLYQYASWSKSLGIVTVYDGFGWSDAPRSLGWSVLCLALAIAWLSSAAYMKGGGTRYDPTDWFQTINTSAGSNLAQIDGTCTGAYLEPRKVNDTKLWYGELYPGHVGFSQQNATPIQPKEKYGLTGESA